MSALDDLIAAVEAGTLGQGDYITEAEGDLIAAVFPLSDDSWEWENVTLAMDGSLDAARALHNALLPGWRWGRLWGGYMWVEPDDMPGRSVRYYSPDGMDDNPARAWLLSILIALRAKGGAA